MSELPVVPSTFLSIKTGERRLVALTVRKDLEADAASAILGDVESVPWGELWHAYGPADDVRDQLIAAAVGDEQTRQAAWWEVFGNIHHQGTIYEATVPALPIIARLARWRAYPDRADAIAFLTAVAEAEGVVVWRYGEGNKIAHDGEREAALSGALRAQMRELSSSVLRSWRDEPAEVRRALLLLLAHSPELQAEYAELITETLPTNFEEAWSAIQTGPESQDAFDQIDAFERWVYGE